MTGKFSGYASARELLTWPSSCHCRPRENKEVFAVIICGFLFDHGAYYIRIIQPALWQEKYEDIDG